MFTKEDYVSLETAKLLKEKGFDNECDYYISEDGNLFYKGILRVYNKIGKVTFLCPTLYEAQKWIWENHKMFVSAAPQPPFTKPLEFFFWIDFPEETIDNYGSLVIVEHFSSFQQALDAGLQETLKLI